MVYFSFIVFANDTGNEFLIFKIPTKNLYRDNIKTGDIFLLDWQRYNNVFISSLFNNSFMHPSISIWENGDLYMIELINYFNSDKYTTIGIKILKIN